MQWKHFGTASPVENCQPGVLFACTTTEGHTLIDRGLYLPKS
ncbi:hypothetical protein [Alloactinosynnema sp. L-07]|nr:hypothetical protein [Alloactinosynnema sp. L-07]